MLGKYTPSYNNGVTNWEIPGPDSYIAKSGTASSYFSLGSDWNKIRISYGLTDDEMFRIFNVPVLDEAISKGKVIKFSHKPTLEIYKGSYLAEERDYLKRNYGFKSLEESGGFWIAK